jgi:cytochrome c biogenesis protein CcdA
MKNKIPTAAAFYFSPILPIIGAAAIIDSVNPCAFSVLLITIAFLFSLEKSRLQIAKIGGWYIAGIFLVYILIGLGILQALYVFNTPHFMAKIGALLIVIFGAINVINVYFPRFPIKLKIPDAAHQKMAKFMEKGSLPAAFLLGALVSLFEFPCTGGPYLMILGLLHDRATYMAGFGYLLFYNLIFILPLVIILFAASNKLLFDKIQEWRKKDMKKMRFLTGVAMIALGIIIFML